jgi:predicted metal-dependent hydrolase
MTREQARELVEVLKAAYPTFQVPDATEKLWLSELAPLKYELAEECVFKVIHSSRFWPEVAKVMVPYQELSAERARERREREQRERLEPPAEVSPEERARMAAEMREYVARIKAAVKPVMPKPRLDRDETLEFLRGEVADPDADIPLP